MLVRRSAMLGAATGAGLVVLELLLAQIRSWQFPAELLAFILGAGPALLLVFGLDRIHDFSFWALSILIDWLVYSFLFLFVLHLRVRTSRVSRGSP